MVERITMKALMYHYVRKFDENNPYSKHKEIDDFYKEIKELIKIGYQFKNVTEAIRSMKNGENTDNILLLTFDDGLKDHIHVAHILKDLGINKATFYIPIDSYKSNRVLHVHKAHLVVSNQGEKALDLLADASNRLNLPIIDHSNYEIERENYKNAYARFKSDERIKEFKRLINFYGSMGARDQLLDEIIENIKVYKSSNEIYLSLDEIKNIADMGFEIGSHGISHTILSRLNHAAQKYELLESKLFLENLINNSIKSFCYPYGGKKSYNNITLKLLKEINYHNAISVEKRDIIRKEIIENPYEIPRYDCNQIKDLLLTS